MKEIQRLCDLGVLAWQPSSDWATPLFIQPKKNKTVRFLTDFWEVSKRLGRKHFPIPKIITVLQELEGFTYAMALDLNMDYYTISWIRMHQRSAPLSFLGISTLTRDYPWE